ncbi:hypothetical protein HID58_064825, partial [Brassica napus]
FLSTKKAEMEIFSEKLLLPICFILSCFFIFTTARFRQSSPRSATLPPGPPRLPIIGNIHQVGKLPHRSFADLSRTYGPIMHLKFGRLNTVIITLPEAAREVLRTHDQTLSDHKAPNAVRSISHHKVSAAWIHPFSARWRLLRKLSVTHLFSPQRIEATKALRMKKVQELVFREFIDIKTADKSLRNDPKFASNRDFLDALLDLTDMFVGGTDTNSSTLEWAMAELLTNPTTMAKAQTEIKQMLGLNGFVQEPDISELPYIQAIVKETFRLHPPVPFLLPREAETDVEIFGYFVPKDAQVLVNVWAIGRDPGVWENPTRFEPERFLGKEIDVKGKNYELTPFGAGRRICPGLPLAVKMVSLMLLSLLYSFDWKLQNAVDMDETFGITLHKANPLHAVPVRRIRH